MTVAIDFFNTVMSHVFGQTFSVHSEAGIMKVGAG